eukprot:9217640-Pyramimonas_sp.AAC.1
MCPVDLGSGFPESDISVRREYRWCRDSHPAEMESAQSQSWFGNGCARNVRTMLANTVDAQ